MSPQFVDFDADGQLDIVAGIFDGSPHLVRGSKEGWLAPEQILDRDGQRIVLNQFWNFDTKKWDETTRCDAGKDAVHGHLTSAVAFDWDGDGDLDLLLGDHRTGHVYVRTNEGTAAKPLFATTNAIVLAAGAPIDVPGTVATLRLVDWNGDGLLDLACGSMGDAYGDDLGGGIWIYPNTGTAKATAYGAPIEVLERSKKDGDGPVRPDSGLYMDFGDFDGDGDLDMVVGGYAHWQPKPRVLTADEEQRKKVLEAEIARLDAAMEAITKAVDDAVKDLDEATADERRTALWKERRPEMSQLGKQRQVQQAELEPLVPGKKRLTYVWYYENRTPAAR